MNHGLVIVSDRGGHLQNALSLLSQLPEEAQALVTTNGPDIDALETKIPVYHLPYCFQWIGKRRFLNPVLVAIQAIFSLFLVSKLRPKKVLSFGASNVVLFCYWARMFGADIYHVECMNQVSTPSVTGRLLYPICQELFVQWQELLSQYGPKAKYEGWVL